MRGATGIACIIFALTYRGGPSPWSLDADDAAPLTAVAEDGSVTPLQGVSSAVTVLSEGQGFALVSRAPLFGNTVSARHASAPEGPSARPSRC